MRSMRRTGRRSCGTLAGASGFAVQVRNTPLADDKTNRSGADRKRIDLSQDYECKYWSEKFGVSIAELKRAVQNVGPMAEDVARELGKRWR
jgi:hypothetical protein